MKKEQAFEKKRIHNFRTKFALVVLTIVILGTIALFGCATDNGGEEISTFKINTAYGTMKFPQSFKENLKHQEIVEENRTIEVFSMVNGETELELYRFVFGDASVGEQIGYYGQTPVTLVVYNYGDTKFPDEQSAQIYFSMMDSLNILLSSMKDNSEFRAGQVPILTSDSTVQMKYWKVRLPNAVEWEEIAEGDIYKVIFYGMIGQTRIKLYTICLGDTDAEAMFGTYMVDGVAKPLTVEVAEMEQIERLPEDDRPVAYAMIDTINDVLQGIRQDENFSAQPEPAA